jgi:hypothetical protein
VTELEQALRELGRELELPASPDVVPAVLTQLQPRPAARLSLRRPTGRRLLVALAVVALAAVAATLAVPEARSALFRVLHIGSERIELVDDLPPVEESDGLGTAFLGEQVSLDEARRRAGFPLRELGEAPDRVYLDGTRPTVWFLYGAPRDVRLLVAQVPGLRVEQDLFLKKLATPATSVHEVSIAGARGYFLSGEPHLVLLLDESGFVVEDSARLAGNVLVWEDGGVTYRLEGDFSEDEAVELAESLR